jgi:proteic killer suppression protein
MIISIKHKGLRLFWETGSYNDFWSLIVNGNWRIIFRFEEENAYDVNLVDYH